MVKTTIKKTSFKKGKVLSLDADMPLMGKAYVAWDTPKGIKKLKVQVTYYTESGKAGIKSVVRSNQYLGWHNGLERILFYIVKSKAKKEVFQKREKVWHQM